MRVTVGEHRVGHQPRQQQRAGDQQHVQAFRGLRQILQQRELAEDRDEARGDGPDGDPEHRPLAVLLPLGIRRHAARPVLLKNCADSTSTAKQAMSHARIAWVIGWMRLDSSGHATRPMAALANSRSRPRMILTMWLSAPVLADDFCHLQPADPRQRAARVR